MGQIINSKVLNKNQFVNKKCVIVFHLEKNYRLDKKITPAPLLV